MSLDHDVLSYSALLRLPHAARLFGAALLGRLSFATVSLGLLLTVQDSTGSFAAAGAAVGAFGLTNVLVSPARARWVDRCGQRVALAALAAGYASLLVVVAVLGMNGAAAWLLVSVAAAAGLCPPPLGAAMRSLWTRLAPGPGSLARAYGLDAVGEELLFVTGPVLVGVTAAVSRPSITLIGSAVLVLTGTIAMTRGPVTIPAHPRRQHESDRSARPLRQPGFRPLLLLLLAAGVVLGTLEVVVPAAARDYGQASLAGLLLSMLSAGSAVGGLLYGTRNWQSPLAGRLFLLVVGLIVVTAALASTQGIGAMAGLLVLGGLLLAPTLVTAYLLADALTPLSVRTEATTWVSTASNAGAALAAAGAGALIEHADIRTTLVLGAGLAAGCTLLAGNKAAVLLSEGLK